MHIMKGALHMDFDAVMQELEALGKERTKKMYISNGAKEPVFGVATGAMKPMVKKIKINQPLAEQLYSTGNYDAMYFAGIIADPKAMTRVDYDRWIEDAYFYMLSDYVVAVTLSESDIAEEVADAWIDSGEELKMSAGWSATAGCSAAGRMMRSKPARYPGCSTRLKRTFIQPPSGRRLP